MKKSFIIFLSLVFMSLSAHAVGVDCWEEVSNTYTPDTVSKMKNILGDKVTITRVKTVVSIASAQTSPGWQIYVPISHYLYTVTDSALTRSYKNFTDSNPTTYKSSSNERNANYSQSGGFGPIYYVYHNYGHQTYGWGATNRGIVFSPGSSSSPIALGFQPYTFQNYIHTYCIVNTNSSGGGGGAAGAAVNYIIKAD